MSGIDWAYERLVRKAALGDKNQVRELATCFRREVLDACVGMACADIDWHSHTAADKAAYTIVFDVCVELTK